MASDTNSYLCRAPFPYFGGKSTIADVVWQRLGEVSNYVEPFCGSCAMLLKRPDPPQLETINDKDGMVANFWRAVQAAPDEVARYADWPVYENDLHARHVWLVGKKDSLQAHLEGDPDFFDAKVAGWWCWGMCCWIYSSAFCTGQGPWRVVDGRFVRLGGEEPGVLRSLIHLGPRRGVVRRNCDVRQWMLYLANRFRYVRVCCGDWSRVCKPASTVTQGLTGVFLDPPYSAKAGRTDSVYRCEDLHVANDVREWALAHGDDPRLRIALCGYEGEHSMPDTWECVAWKAQGGFAHKGKRAAKNAFRERIWFSPHCLKPKHEQTTLLRLISECKSR